jgi:hypothetical protein
MMLLLLGHAACASATKPPSQSTFYSTVPCPDACGNDSQCLAKCVPAAGNNPPPAGLVVGH